MLPLSCLYVDPMLAYMDPMLTLCWPKSPLSCPYVDPMFTLCSPMLALEMLSPIAVTETAEVGTGWERGEDDQVGGWGGTPL